MAKYVKELPGVQQEKKEKIWQIAHNPCGRPRHFKKPIELWKKALEYFQWVDDNPWQIKSASNSLSSMSNEDEEGDKRNAIRQDVRVMQRAYTLYGFCAFAGIYKWGDFKRNYSTEESKNTGFLEVIYAIEHIVKSQQVDGALLHQFDSNLVARLNGIADVSKTEVTGADGTPLILPKLSDDDLEKIKALNERLR